MKGNIHKYMDAIKRENLTHRVVDSLKKYIISRNLKQGDKLPSESELGQILLVSRNVIREAMKSLEASGIVCKKQGKGVFISSFQGNLQVKNIMFGLNKSRSNLNEMLEVRKAFEISVLKLIINKITDNDIRDLQLIIDEMREIEEKKLPSIKIDLKFHLELLKILKNDFIERLGMILEEFFKEQSLLEQSLSLDSMAGLIEFREHNRKEVLAKRHQKILDALKERDLEKAIEAMQKHVSI